MHKYITYKAKGACEFYRNLTELAVFRINNPAIFIFECMNVFIHSVHGVWVKWYIALH